MSNLRYLCLFAYSGVKHMCCVFVLLFFVLCTLCSRFRCSFLRLVYPMLQVSLFFSSSCVPYVPGFAVLFFVLYTLCCRFHCSFLRLVYPMLPVSLDCQYLTAPLVFPVVYYLVLTHYVYIGYILVNVMSSKTVSSVWKVLTFGVIMKIKLRQ